jgi:4-amino-4-deoxy-L-arabinose transferase-like glycosyltransferase
MHENDPLWRLRHALLGLLLALALSVPIAALLGRWIGDALGGSYGWRAGSYALLLLHLVIGTVVLFVRVARHETRPLTPSRVLLWLASLWLWPVVLVMSRRATSRGRRGSGSAGPPASSP